MSDRLQQLRRQRALVAEHLAWLDREINSALNPTAPHPPAPTVQSAPIVAPTPAPFASQVPFATAPSPADDSAVAAVADEIIEQYRPGRDTTKSDVRKGCLLYFFSALAFVILVVAVLYFVFESGK